MYCYSHSYCHCYHLKQTPAFRQYINSQKNRNNTKPLRTPKTKKGFDRITLWKFRLSSKGTATPNLVLFLSQVMVFRQTGSKISAMFNLRVSAPPFAMQTQVPITSYAALFLYCKYFHKNSPNITPIQSAITQTLCQLSNKKYLALPYHLIIGLSSCVGLSFWLSIWLKFRLSPPPLVGFGACSKSISKFSTCFPANVTIDRTGTDDFLISPKIKVITQM